MADKATAVSFRYGSTGEHKNFKGVKGEITVDIETPTVWVHTGNDQIGTPLAREDLDNVTQTSITNKGIAKNDLTNVTISDVNTVRENLLSLNYANRDLSDITENAIANLDNTYARNTLANVEKTSITAILDGTQESENTYAKYDLSNITQAKLANKGLAKTDLSNVNVSAITDKGIATNTLDNVTLSDTIRDTSHLDLQKVSNLVSLDAPEASLSTTYPTAVSVNTAINAIPPMITNIVVDTETTSPTAGEILINISKDITKTSPGIYLINGQIITGTWACLMETYTDLPTWEDRVTALQGTYSLIPDTHIYQGKYADEVVSDTTNHHVFGYFDTDSNYGIIYIDLDFNSYEELINSTVPVRWKFTPRDGTETMKILTDSWVITVA